MLNLKPNEHFVGFSYLADECAPEATLLGPSTYQPEIWSIKKDLIIKTIAALELGLENTQEVLIDHDTRLGRDMGKNKRWAEILKGEIKDIQDCIRELKVLNISNSTHYP